MTAVIQAVTAPQSPAPALPASSAKSPFSAWCETSEDQNSEHLLELKLNKSKKNEENMGGDDNKNEGIANI